MPDEKRPLAPSRPEPTSADVMRAVQNLTDHVHKMDRDWRANAKETGHRLETLETARKHHSGFISGVKGTANDANERASKVGDELTDLKAAVVTAVANVEHNARAHRAQVDAKLDALTNTVATINSDTKGQNVELAAQTASLETQGTTLSKVAKTPSRTAWATFAALVIGKLIDMAMNGQIHWPH